MALPTLVHVLSRDAVSVSQLAQISQEGAGDPKFGGGNNQTVSVVVVVVVVSSRKNLWFYHPH